MTQEALKLALEYLESRGLAWNVQIALREALRENAMREVQRLGQEIEQTPVALEAVYETIIQWDEGGGKRSRRELARRIVALYTTPPQRTWVGLTDEEKSELWEISRAALPRYATYSSLVEAKLKQKNGYAEEKNNAA